MSSNVQFYTLNKSVYPNYKRMQKDRNPLSKDVYFKKEALVGRETFLKYTSLDREDELSNRKLLF